MNAARRQALIEAHRDLRKEAFEAVAPKVAEYFRDAEAALGEAKHASESAAFDPAIRRHLVEP
jgi:hypothetical protein